jgi:hypothetical protein
VNTLHKKLLSQGFYAPATNEEILSTYSIGDIKNVISKLGLNIKGKKQDLIKGLIDQVDEKTLSINLFNGYTSISSKGKDWMAVHELEFSWYNATEEHASLEEFKKHQAQKNDKQGNIEKLQADIAKDKETFGRYIYDELISIYKEDEKNQDILVCLLKELLIDLSGSYDYLTWKKLGFDKDIMGKPFQIIFTPYLVKTLPKYKNDFVVSILDRVYEIELPVNVCDKIIFNEIITRIFEGALSVEEQKKYIKKLNSKLLEKI